MKIAVALLVLVVVVVARDVKWTGAGDGYQWDDPNNWNIKALPTINDDVTVIFDETDELYINNVTANAQTLHIVQVQIYAYMPINVAGEVNGDSESLIEKFGDVKVGQIIVGGNGVNVATVNSFIADHVYVFDASTLNITNSASVTETLILRAGKFIGGGSATLKAYNVQITAAGSDYLPAAHKLPKKVVDKFKSKTPTVTAPAAPSISTVSGVDITAASFYITKADNEVLFVNGASLEVAGSF